MPEAFNPADGVAIACEVHGDGTPALVFVHGWSCDRSYWREQLTAFSRSFKVVAIDLAGHGESGAGRESWTIEAFGEDVAAVVAALGLERAILVGHSMGGDVIVEAARRCPGRVEGLIWVDVYRQLRDWRTPDEIRAFIAPFRADFETATRVFVKRMFPPDADQALVERVATDMSSAPETIALETLESAKTFQRKVTDGLQVLKLPVIAINPEDRPTDFDSMAAFGIEVVPMPNVGHFPMLEDPEAFNALFEQAIGKILGRAQRGTSASVEALILDLLEWIGPKPRPYAEVIEAWRTSCPRLPVWEDANQRGYIDHRHEPGRGSWVAVSAAGREHLRRQRLPTQV